MPLSVLTALPFLAEAMIATPRAVHPMPLESTGAWVNAIASLGFVILLLLGLSWGLQRLQRKGLFGTRSNAAPDAQLAVLQQLPLDAKTRLVLVRRGNQGHLLCLHAQGATLVESGIDLEAVVPADAISMQTPGVSPLKQSGLRPQQIILKEPLQ